MLNDDEFKQWSFANGLSADAQALISQIRSSPPSRRVRSSAWSVSGRYPSRKMGVTIQFESHKMELSAIYEMEYASDVLEYYDQPPAIKLDYRSAKGRHLGVLHTPDFFVLRANEAGWEECKTEDELHKLAEKAPQRYIRSEEGSWRCPPGESYASSFGLYYRFRSSAETDWTYQRNIQFLEDYLRGERLDVQPVIAVPLLTFVAARPGITLADLVAAFPGVDADSVYAMVIAGQLYIDLRASLLAEPTYARVFRDPDTARAYTLADTARFPAPPGGPRYMDLSTGASLLWDGKPWTLLNDGNTEITLMSDEKSLVHLPADAFVGLVRDGKVTGLDAAGGQTDNRTGAVEILEQASVADLEEANRRYSVIAPYLDKPCRPRSRTLRRWLDGYREAEIRHGYGIVGLLPRTSKRGNRSRKLAEETLRLIDEVIGDDYETVKQKSKVRSYGNVVRACQQRGLTAPSYKTFVRTVNSRPVHQQILKRQGSRVAYRHERFYWELSPTTPRHGDRPFEIGHVDHTELDVELVDSRTGKNLGRPWATFMTDAFSRRLLAVYLTFDPPSYRSCMMAVRICVRRHGRLPQTLVVDGGKEFESVFFEILLARCECIKKTRPAAKARFGSVCERLFGTANTTFVHNLAGNTQITRNVRQMTKAVDPRKHAVWTLGALYKRFCEWAYEVYDTVEHPSLGQTPREALAAGLTAGGVRKHIPYDEAFRILTLPTTPKGTAKVDPSRGVKINHVYYWCEGFRDPAIGKKQVPVRWDPFDMGTAYAYVGGRWARCISEHHAAFRGRTEREVLLASAELRKRNQNRAQTFTITARKLADFLVSVESEETLAAQRARDAESHHVLRVIEGDAPATGDHDKPQTVVKPPVPDVSKAAEPQRNPQKLEYYEEYN